MDIKLIYKWADTLKLWSQRINALIAGLGSVYMFLTAEMKEDLGPTVVTVLAVLAATNIVVRNIRQADITVKPEQP